MTLSQEFKGIKVSSDHHAARLLLARHGDDMLHVLEEKRQHAWYVWAERGWRRDDNDTHVYRWCTELGEDLGKWAAERLRRNDKDVVGKAARAMCNRLRTNAGVEQTLKSAQRQRTPAKLADFDRNHRALPCINGVLYLLDHKPYWEFKKWDEVDREDCLFLKNTNTYFDIDATHPLWVSAVDTFLPHEDTRNEQQKVLGRILEGGNPNGAIVFAIGDTNSGKSTLINTCKTAVGDFGGTLDASVLRRKSRPGAPSEERAMVHDKRFAVASELGHKTEVDADQLKSLTGGDSQIVHGKYAHGTDGPAQFTPILMGNTSVRVAGADEAYKGRLIGLSFPNPQPHKDDRALKMQEDPECRSAALSWLARGWCLWKRDGLSPNREMRQCKAELFKESSPVLRWRSEWCEVCPAGKSKSTYAERDEQLWQSFAGYQEHAEVPARERISRDDFLQQLRGLGHRSGTSRHVRGHVGVTRARLGLRLKAATTKKRVR